MRLKREMIVEGALKLLNEVGLDEFTTRRLADRLGIQSPTLYWHFKSKRALLDAMAYAMLKEHDLSPLPSGADWRVYWQENARSLRLSLLAYRDGARVHAGTMPSINQLPRAEAMMRLMCSDGFAPEVALSIIVALSRFVVGWVLEEQAAAGRSDEQQWESDPSRQEFPLLSQAWEMAKVQGSDRAFDHGLAFFLSQPCPGVKSLEPIWRLIAGYLPSVPGLYTVCFCRAPACCGSKPSIASISWIFHGHSSRSGQCGRGAGNEAPSVIDTWLLQVFWILAIIAGSRQIRKRNKRLPLLTLSMSAILAACLVLQFVESWILPLVQRNAPAILSGQWWRMGTALFFQEGWLVGGISNIVGLLVIGALAEQILARWTWLVIYAIGGLASETIALAWQPVGAGNSIAICALAGFLLLAPLFDRPLELSRIASGSGTMRVLAATAVLVLLLRHDIHGAGALAGGVLTVGAAALDFGMTA